MQMVVIKTLKWYLRVSITIFGDLKLSIHYKLIRTMTYVKHTLQIGTFEIL